MYVSRAFLHARCFSLLLTDNRASVCSLFVSTLGAGDYFGEMALMLDEPRHANVISLSPLKCLTLDRQQFVELLGPLSDVLSRNMRIRILKSVPLLANLTDDELDCIACAMRVQVFEDGEYIIRQGEVGTRFYIINEGEVVCTANDPSSPTGERELIKLSNQEYFGERALIHREPRKANVIAVSVTRQTAACVPPAPNGSDSRVFGFEQQGRVECLVLERNDFESLLGSLTDAMEKEQARREAIGNKKVTSKKSNRANFEEEILTCFRWHISCSWTALLPLESVRSASWPTSRSASCGS
jgi:CRP-like cAMP-binding protein